MARRVSSIPLTERVLHTCRCVRVRACRGQKMDTREVRRRSTSHPPAAPRDRIQGPARHPASVLLIISGLPRATQATAATAAMGARAERTPSRADEILFFLYRRTGRTGSRAPQRDSWRFLGSPWHAACPRQPRTGGGSGKWELGDGRQGKCVFFLGGLKLGFVNNDIRGLLSSPREKAPKAVAVSKARPSAAEPWGLELGRPFGFVARVCFALRLCAFWTDEVSARTCTNQPSCELSLAAQSTLSLPKACMRQI